MDLSRPQMNSAVSGTLPPMQSAMRLLASKEQQQASAPSANSCSSVTISALEPLGCFPQITQTPRRHI